MEIQRITQKVIIEFRKQFVLEKLSKKILQKCFYGKLESEILVKIIDKS